MEACNAAHLDRQITIARRYARRAGLPAEVAEDCALAFVADHCAATPPRNVASPDAWFRVCLRHHILNWLRGEIRRDRHESAWPEARCRDGKTVPRDYRGDLPDPQLTLLKQEFWRDMKRALRLLKPCDRRLFLRHVFREVPVPNLAERFGITTAAAYKRVSRAAERVCVALGEQGWTYAEARRCFVPPR